MLLDRRHPRKKMIDLFREPRVAGAQLFEPFNAAVDHRPRHVRGFTFGNNLTPLAT